MMTQKPFRGTKGAVTSGQAELIKSKNGWVSTFSYLGGTSPNLKHGLLILVSVIPFNKKRVVVGGVFGCFLPLFVQDFFAIWVL
jgi:hypothetical protein